MSTTRGSGPRRHRRRPGRPGSTRLIPSAPTPSSRRRPSSWPRRYDGGVGDRRAAPPRRQSRASTHRWSRSSAGRTPRWSASGSAASTTTTSTRRGRRSARRSPPRSALAKQLRPGPGGPHPRRLGRHVRHPGAQGVPERTVFHCFTGGPAEARAVPRPRRYLSFSGIVTFKNAGDVRAAAALCPPTGSSSRPTRPFLAPVPHRGQPNEPAWVPLVGAAVAARHGRAPELRRGGDLGQRRGGLPAAVPRPASRRPVTADPAGPRSTATCSSAHGVSAQPGLGQNFVADPNTVGASPGWPTSARATGWSRSVPGSARSRSRSPRPGPR